MLLLVNGGSTEAERLKRIILPSPSLRSGQYTQLSYVRYALRRRDTDHAHHHRLQLLLAGRAKRASGGDYANVEAHWGLEDGMLLTSCLRTESST